MGSEVGVEGEAVVGLRVTALRERRWEECVGNGEAGEERGRQAVGVERFFRDIVYSCYKGAGLKAQGLS
jgi:hypothetical protein